MSFFQKLERKFGRYAIPNLMFYIVMLYAAGLVIGLFNPMLYIRYLALDAPAILHGQIWRIVTFMLWPPMGVGGNPMNSILWNVLILFMYYSIGNTLERVWGSFRFNVYFFMGVIGHVLAAVLGYALFGQVWWLTTEYLNFSLFFAFAATFPDAQFYLYFVIPVKAKWLAIADAAFFLYGFVKGGPSVKCAVVLSMLNFIIFFLMTRNYNRINPKEIKRKREFKTKTKILPQGKSHHKCAVCGRTEVDSPGMEFRYCSKCDGNYEYCMDHLYTHRHVTAAGGGREEEQ